MVELLNHFSDSFIFGFLVNNHLCGISIPAGCKLIRMLTIRKTDSVEYAVVPYWFPSPLITSMMSAVRFHIAAES